MNSRHIWARKASLSDRNTYPFARIEWHFALLSFMDLCELLMTKHLESFHLKKNGSIIVSNLKGLN